MYPAAIVIVVLGIAPTVAVFLAPDAAFGWLEALPAKAIFAGACYILLVVVLGLRLISERRHGGDPIVDYRRMIKRNNRVCTMIAVSTALLSPSIELFETIAAGVEITLSTYDFGIPEALVVITMILGNLLFSRAYRETLGA